jgi:glycolate oxidase FAD binding subunit
MTLMLGNLDDLRSSLGAELISQRADGSVVASPRTTDEVAAVTRYSNDNKLILEIAGAGTKSGWGHPVDAHILLETTKLVGVREHMWQDLTATVAAGTTWSTLQRTLAAHNQRVVLDPLWPNIATVGGIIASNDSGVLRSRYGSLRDLIIGMTIVLADGTIAKTGGKVVKNVAGYDLHKLMTGAFGTLGVITEVVFRLHPMPKCSANWTIVSSDVAALDRVRRQLADSTIFFEALQMRTDEGGFALDVGLVSQPECIDDYSLRLHTLAEPLSIIGADDAVWSVREHSFEANKATVKVAISATHIAQFTSEVLSMGGRSVTQQSGIMMATLPCDSAQVSSFRNKVEACGGTLTVLYWPVDIMPRPEIWGTPTNSLPLMREIKRQFDPNRTLNRGCFLDGI